MTVAKTDFYAPQVLQATPLYGALHYNGTTYSQPEWYSIAWSPALKLFAATDYSWGCVMTSPDGVKWTMVRDNIDGVSWISICWADTLGLFVAVSSNNSSGTKILTSSDGITWSASTITDADNCSWNNVIWSHETGVLVAVGATHDGTAGRIMTSSNGTTWSFYPISLPYSPINVAWSKQLSLFVITAVSGYYTSTNTVSWTSHSGGVGSLICWSAELGIFSTGTHWSRDGFAWTSNTGPSMTNMRAIAWGYELGLFLAAGDDGTLGAPNGKLATSADGLTWSNVATPTFATTQFASIGYSPSLALFAIGAIGYSTTQRVATYSVNYNNSILVRDPLYASVTQITNFENNAVTNLVTGNTLTTGGTVTVNSVMHEFGSYSGNMTGGAGGWWLPDGTPAYNAVNTAFTLEFWFNQPAADLISYTAYRGAIFVADHWGQTSGTSNTGWKLYSRGNGSASGTNQCVFVMINTIILQTTGQGTDWAYNTWNHLAVTRNGNYWRMWINGTSVANAVSNSAVTVQNFPSIGKGSHSNGSDAAFKGFVDSVRWTGTARYDANSNTISVPITDFTYP